MYLAIRTKDNMPQKILAADSYDDALEKLKDMIDQEFSVDWDDETTEAFLQEQGYSINDVDFSVAIAE